MDVKTEKLKLIQWIAELDEDQTLQTLIFLKENSYREWQEDISQEELNEINDGLTQADKGQIVRHEDVMKKYQKWL